jgi:DnaJ-class molecular chaperone|tara:strand:+ start:241 stop:498 length:258 start_codon:yes stop_codon:yes gene_type:complete
MGVYGMLNRICCVCSAPATAKEGSAWLCSDHWLMIWSPKTKSCEECGGDGQVEYERPVVDFNRGGYLEGYMDNCEQCNGSGEVNE